MITFIGSSIVSMVINLLIFLFYRKIYKPKYNSKALYVVSYVAACVLTITVNGLGVPFFNIVYSFLSANIISIALFKEKLKKSFLYNNLFIVVLFFSDVITTIIWTVIHGNTLAEILSSYQLMLMSNLLNIVIMVLSFRIYVLILSKNEINSIRMLEAIFLVLMTVFESFVVVVYASKVAARIDGVYIICILVGFLVLNFFMTYIIRQVSQSYKDKYELSISKKQIEMQLIHYREMNQKYQESVKIAHDVKKHLAILKGLKNQDESKAEKYSGLIEEKVDELFCRFYCTNEILSIVMSQKISAAEALEIKVDTKVENVLLDFMDDFDITALFANLWDNAIEACSKIEKKDRYITINLKKVNDFIVLSVENSFDGHVTEKNNKILSSKIKHNGVGLSIIKSTVKKYNGVFVMKHAGNVFRSEITLSMPVKN